MIYDIRHVTTYDYGTGVQSAHCLVHLTPRSTARQTVLSASLAVEPHAVECVAFTDFFGNAAKTLRFQQPHARLELRASARVSVEPQPLPEGTSAWEDIRAASLALRDLTGSSPVHHLFASRHVPLQPATRDYARASFAPGRPVLTAALDLLGRIHAEFAFDADATDVSTPVAEVLESRRGVCQDFAHLMIAALRGMGLPAAYVSGYLRTIPPPGQERLAGADASHAWVSLWCGPEHGWVGLDPTNGVAAGEDHVVLAIGRDYDDVSPVSGIVLAAADQTLEVQVDVLPVSGRQALAG